MSRPGVPPTVDEGDATGLFSAFRQQLATTPGRFENASRLLVLTLITVTIGEVFRLPDIVIFAYVAFFVSSNDEGSTIMTALLAGVALGLGTLATIALLTATLSEPALRIPMMAVLTFLAGFLSKASPLGPAFYAFGFWLVYSTTNADSPISAALSSVTVDNTVDPATMNPEFSPPNSSATGSMPGLAFYPPDEALVHNMLWLGFIVLLAVVIVVVVNLLTGRDPGTILRHGLADRLGAAANYCGGVPGARGHLAKLAKEGTGTLLKMNELNSKLRRHSRIQGISEQLIRQLAHLDLALLAWRRVADDDATEPLQDAGRICRQAEQSVRAGKPLFAQAPSPDPDGAAPEPTNVPDAALPLLAAVSRTTEAIQRILSDQFAAENDDSKVDKQSNGFLSPDAFTNPEYRHFALKLTLAVMICYFIERFADWPGIHTCMITCFFVSLETVGQSVHKMMLRICGCLAGATVGFAAILFVMPLMNDLGDLLLLLAPITFAAAWVKSGSERVAYGGQQMALAFFICVLQGFGPTLDMQDARDRVIGILVGLFAVYVIFTLIWPVSVAEKVRANLANALERLADLLALRHADPGKPSASDEERLRQRFGQAIAKTRSFLVNDPYEPDAIRQDRNYRHAINADTVTQVQALVIPVSVILGHQPDPAWRDAVPAESRAAIHAHHQALADWFRRYAAWIRNGEGVEGLAASLPKPPILESHGRAGEVRTEKGAVARHLAARTEWYRLLHRDICAVLEEIGPVANATAALPAQDAALTSA